MTLEKDSAKSAAVMTDFLSSALPDIYRSMPDWSKVTGQSSGTPNKDNPTAPAEPVVKASVEGIKS